MYFPRKIKEFRFLKLKKPCFLVNFSLFWQKIDFWLHWGPYGPPVETQGALWAPVETQGALWAPKNVIFGPKMAIFGQNHHILAPGGPTGPRVGP